MNGRQSASGEGVAVKRFDVKPGETIMVTLPYSEVCMHMRVAGKTLPVMINERSAQIIDEDGGLCGAPVTLGEAGIYMDEQGGMYILQ